MSGTHSSTEVRQSGMLETGDGNRVYWEERGNPDGKPALIVHGGPGGGSPSGTPKLFDPERYRIILFDQRGCGRSTPHASELATDMSLNTTEHLLRDMEQLRAQLEVEQWLLFGGSWGSALSVAYAERHPERVSEMVLPAFWLMGRAEVDWLYRGGVAQLFPAEWERFRNDVTEPGDVVAAYVTLMNDPDVQVRSRAALNWSAWEDAVLSLELHGKPAPFSDRASAWLESTARLIIMARRMCGTIVRMHCRVASSVTPLRSWRKMPSIATSVAVLSSAAPTKSTMPCGRTHSL